MFDDVAVYNQRIMSAEQLPAVVNQAIRMAYTKKGVSVLTIPDDVPKFEVKMVLVLQILLLLCLSCFHKRRFRCSKTRNKCSDKTCYFSW